MHYIDQFSQESYLEIVQKPLIISVIISVANFCGRVLELFSNEKNKIPQQDKTESLAKSYFVSPEIQRENEKVLDSSPLLVQIKQQQKNDGDFDFCHEISEINKDDSIKDKEAELAGRFCKIVNPHRIPDGHCASCAFNTHLHLIGQKLEEGRDPNGNFKEFGDWFYRKVYCRFEDNVVESGENETYGAMRDRLEQKVKELTQPGEAVLISICDGTHWYNAYNDGTRVWFIDSQSGKGFNLYDSNSVKPEDIINDSQIINIIHLKAEDISEYNAKFIN
jgi:glutamine deamidase